MQTPSIDRANPRERRPAGERPMSIAPRDGSVIQVLVPSWSRRVRVQWTPDFEDGVGHWVMADDHDSAIFEYLMGGWSDGSATINPESQQ